jgi:hypothetical protein
MPDSEGDKQLTQPKKGEPVEIPIPSKDQIVKDFEKIVSAPKQGESGEEGSSSD